MSKAVKSAIIDDLVSQLDGTDSAVVISAGGLTVAETEGLRNKLREEGFSCEFLRNRLARFAFDRVGMEGLHEVLAGPCAIVFGGEGALPISKSLAAEARTIATLELVGGYIDGEVLDAVGVTELSKIPGKKELQSMVLVGMFGPVSDMHASLNNLLTEMHGLVEALGEKKDGEV